MRYAPRATLMLALALLATPALAVKVTVDYDKTYNFFQPVSVAWGQGSPWQNEINQRRTEAAVQRELEAKGLTFKDSAADADLVVVLHPGRQQTAKSSNVSVGVGVSRRTRYGGIGIGTSTGGGTKVVEEGTLVIQLVDTKTEKLVWRADAKGTIEGNADKMEKKVNSAVEKAFKDYPPH